MKKLLLVFLLFPLVSFGQSQILNGIEINAPLGFKKTDNLFWEKGDDMVLVKSVKELFSDSVIKQGISQETRGSKFIKFVEQEIDGVNYFIGLNRGLNGFLIAATGVRKNEHTYFITVGINPKKYSSETIVLKNAMFNISYMINRILVF
jgi:hypothetical protein